MLARRSLDLTRERGHRGYEAWTLRLLAQIAAHPGKSDLAPAEALDSAALSLASELHMRPLMAHCHSGLSRLYDSAGREHDACRHNAAAGSLYRELDMRK